MHNKCWGCAEILPLILQINQKQILSHGSPDLEYTEFGYFTMLFFREWQRNIPSINACVELLYFSLTLLFVDVPIAAATAAVVCLNPVLFLPQEQHIFVFISSRHHVIICMY